MTPHSAIFTVVRARLLPVLGSWIGCSVVAAAAMTMGASSALVLPTMVAVLPLLLIVMLSRGKSMQVRPRNTEVVSITTELVPGEPTYANLVAAANAFVRSATADDLNMLLRRQGWWRGDSVFSEGYNLSAVALVRSTLASLVLQPLILIMALLESVINLVGLASGRWVFRTLVNALAQMKTLEEDATSNEHLENREHPFSTNRPGLESETAVEAIREFLARKSSHQTVIRVGLGPDKVIYILTTDAPVDSNDSPSDTTDERLVPAQRKSGSSQEIAG